jgi:hypothetical protein
MVVRNGKTIITCNLADKALGPGPTRVAGCCGIVLSGSCRLRELDEPGYT